MCAFVQKRFIVQKLGFRKRELQTNLFYVMENVRVEL